MVSPLEKVKKIINIQIVLKLHFCLFCQKYKTKLYKGYTFTVHYGIKHSGLQGSVLTALYIKMRTNGSFFPLRNRPPIELSGTFTAA